jgi:cytochrome c-type biogenesis protein CcmH
MVHKCRTGLRLLLVPFLLLASAASFAVEPDEVLSNPVLEARARALSAELRCVVCQNQSIDDSNAPLARDLRLLLRERLTAGDSDEEVKQYLVERYGTFVLLKPPFNGRTILLWLMPAMVLAGAAVFVLRHVGRAREMHAEGSRKLTSDEEAKLRLLLAEADSPVRDGSTDR